MLHFIGVELGPRAWRVISGVTYGVLISIKSPEAKTPPSIKCNAGSKNVLWYTNPIALQNASSGIMIYYDPKAACHYKMTNQLGSQIS